MIFILSNKRPLSRPASMRLAMSGRLTIGGPLEVAGDTMMSLPVMLEGVPLHCWYSPSLPPFSSHHPAESHKKWLAREGGGKVSCQSGRSGIPDLMCPYKFITYLYRQKNCFTLYKINNIVMLFLLFHIL